MVARRYEIYLQVLTRYLTSERSERVRYRFEHEKINFISPSTHVLFCLFYKPTNNEVFDDFPKISDHFRRFPKILKMLSSSHTNVSENFRKFPKNFRRFPKIPEEDPKMFRLNIDKPWPIEHCNMANSGS